QSFLGVVIIQDNLLKYVNKAISIIYGYSIEEMTNWPALEFFKAVHPEDRAIAMERVRRKVDAELADSIVHPYRVFTKSGEIKWVESYSRTIQYKGKNAFLATLLDISEKKEAEQKLRESEEKFRLAFENAADAIIWADVKTGLIINCNKKAEILLEKKKEEIIGSHQTTLHPPDVSEQYAKMFKIHIEQSGALNEDASVITKSGKIIPVHITASVTLIGGESIIQGIFRDISKH
ncbi:MAG: PAS domain-containing protein, partial [Candidatus Hermodarchaeota archaeon]